MEQEKKAPPNLEVDVTDKEKQISKSVKFRLQDPVYRKKFLMWLCIPLGMFTVGVLDSQGGATLLDLQIITSTGQQLSGLYFTAYNLGYVLGSFAAGFLYGKINSYLLLTVSTIVAGGATIASPYCDTFLLMFIIKCLVGFFLGITLCIGSAEHMSIWGTKGESLLQLMNFVYAVGGIVGPIMASPFITELDRSNKTQSHQNLTLGDLLGPNVTFNGSLLMNMTCDDFLKSGVASHNLTEDILTLDSFTNLTVECLNHTQANSSNLPQETRVQYAYLIGGIICELTAILYFISLLKSNKGSSNEKVKNDTVTPNRNLPLVLKVFMAALLWAFYLFYSSIEVIFNSYLLVFIVRHFTTINTHEADYVMTYYWVLFAVGRFISIFTSKYIKPEILAYIHLFLIAAAVGGLIGSALAFRFDILVGCACLMGLGCSATYPAVMSWTERELMKVDGAIAAIILIGAAGGAMITPFAVGDLMESVDNMWFCYILLLVFVVCICALVILMIFNRFYVDKKYGKFRTVLLQEKLQDLPNVVVDATKL